MRQVGLDEWWDELHEALDAGQIVTLIPGTTDGEPELVKATWNEGPEDVPYSRHVDADTRAMHALVYAVDAARKAEAAGLVLAE